MKSLSTLCVAAATLATALSAQAVIIDAKFSGNVKEQAGTTFAVGAAISGEFFFDTATNKYLSFVIGGLSVAPGFDSKADMSPDQYQALYQADLSALTPGVTINSNFKLDLQAGGAFFPTNSAVALLTSSALASNLDPLASSFGFYTGNADGTNIKSLNASLKSLSITAVPEPSTALMLAAGAALLALRGVRKARA
jgi:hypothetical protein